MEKILEELGEGKEYDKDILYEKNLKYDIKCQSDTNEKKICV